MALVGFGVLEALPFMNGEREKKWFLFILSIKKL
jgi:hypothetical protein